MSRFLVLYRADESAAKRMAETSPEQAAAGMQAWMAWFERAGSAVLDGGSPTQGGDGTVGGYSLIEAPNVAAAQALLADHPHREVGGIDVLELLPMPGM